MRSHKDVETMESVARGTSRIVWQGERYYIKGGERWRTRTRVTRLAKNLRKNRTLPGHGRVFEATDDCKAILGLRENV